MTECISVRTHSSACAVYEKQSPVHKQSVDERSSMKIQSCVFPFSSDVQRSSVQYMAAQHGMVYCRIALRSPPCSSTAQRSVVQSSVESLSVVSYAVIQSVIVQYSTVQHILARFESISPLPSTTVWFDSDRSATHCTVSTRKEQQKRREEINQFQSG